jgi:hypothetical protein
VENPQSGRVAKTLVDLDEVHADLTASGGFTAGIHCGGFSPFLRQTLRPSPAKNDVEMSAGAFYFRNRILGDDAAIVFDFRLELIVR